MTHADQQQCDEAHRHDPEPELENLDSPVRDLEGTKGRFEEALKLIDGNDEYEAIEGLVHQARGNLKDIIDWHDREIRRLER